MGFAGTMPAMERKMVMSREADRIVEKWEQVQEQRKMEERLGSPQNIFAKVIKEMSKPKSKPKPKPKKK